MLLLAISGIFWSQPWAPYVTPASVERMAFPLPEQPSIAVLPFENLSGDPEQDYFSDGFTEDIITTLSKQPRLFVISRNSAFTYKNKPVKVQEVAEELGVRYVLEGSIQRSGEQVRVNAQLVDAVTGRHVWAERYDRQMNEVFEVRDRLIFEIATELLVELTEGEQVRLGLRYTESLEAWEHARRALIFLRRHNREGNSRARELYQKALEIDPKYFPMWTELGWTHWFEARLGWTSSPRESLEEAIALANKTLEVDSGYGGAYRLLGATHLLKHEYDPAVDFQKKSIALDPSDAQASATYGFVLNYAGDPEEAIVQFQRAMRLSPYYPAWYLYNLGLSYHLAGQYDEAIKTLKQGIKRTPDNFFPHVRLAAVYSDLGRIDEACTEAAEVLRTNPKFSIEAYSRASPFKDPAVTEHRINLLRQAGLPD